MISQSDRQTRQRVSSLLQAQDWRQAEATTAELQFLHSIDRQTRFGDGECHRVAAMYQRLSESPFAELT